MNVYRIQYVFVEKLSFFDLIWFDLFSQQNINIHGTVHCKVDTVQYCTVDLHQTAHIKNLHFGAVYDAPLYFGQFSDIFC